MDDFLEKIIKTDYWSNRKFICSKEKIQKVVEEVPILPPPITTVPGPNGFIGKVY